MKILFRLVYLITTFVLASGKHCIAPVYCTGEHDHQPGWMQVYPALRCGGNSTCAKHEENFLMPEKTRLLYKNMTESLREDITNLTKSNAILQDKLISVSAKVNRLVNNNTKLQTENANLGKKLLDLSQDNNDLDERLTALTRKISVENAEAIAKMEKLESKIGYLKYIRLVNGSSFRSGRIEVLYNDTWGTVCDDDWSKNNGNVICKQLGFSKSVWNRKDRNDDNKYGNGVGNIWLDQVRCKGDETSILFCQHSPVGKTDCTHAEDAAVECE